MTGDNQFTEAVAKLVRRIRIEYPGHRLSVEDERYIRSILVIQSGLIMDLGLADSGACTSWFTFLSGGSLNVCKYDDTFKWYSQFLIDSLNRGIENWNHTIDGHYRIDRRSFKHYVLDHHLYWGCVAPVCDQTLDYLESPTVETFRILRQWACLVSRVNLRSVDLRSTCEQQYIDAEKMMHEWVYPLDVLSSLQTVVTGWMKDFHVDYRNCRHGPGSVAEGAGRPTASIKHEIMSMDSRLRYLRLHSDCPYHRFVGDLDRTSELVCVPKGIQKNRTISKEPVSLQYHQQAVFHSLMRYLKESEGLGQHVDLFDQAKSQQMALYGSLAGDYATIDLSNASDSVTLASVKALFRKTPVYRDLICCRSDRTRLSDGSVVELAKFAPMGSACCFPVECIVFSAICEVAVQRVTGHIARSNDYRVYGDDIVIRSDCAEECLRLLDEMHFTVNQSKSYWSRLPLCFREACGIEAVAGEIVTPLRLSRWLRHDDPVAMLSVSVVSSWCALANACLERGLKYTRQVVLKELRSFERWEMIPFYPITSEPKAQPALATWEDCCTNYRARARWNRHTFLRETKVVVGITRPNRSDMSKYSNQYTLSPHCDDGRLEEYWCLHERLRDENSGTIQYRIESGVTFSPEAVVADPVRLEWRTKWVGLDI